MSNISDELLNQRSKVYFEHVKKLEAQNADKAKRLKEWEADKSPDKPTRQAFLSMNGGAALSEQEISKRATAVADQFVKDKQRAEKMKPRRSFADKVKEVTPKEKFQKAHDNIQKRQHENTLVFEKQREKDLGRKLDR